jgi:succinyl-CoA synthetase beta subunit
MNIYSRALRHIDIEDVKQKHQEKIVEKKINEEKESQKKEYIALVMEEKKSDWRTGQNRVIINKLGNPNKT